MREVCSTFLDQTSTIDWLFTMVGVLMIVIIGLILWLMSARADCALLQAELEEIDHHG